MLLSYSVIVVFQNLFSCSIKTLLLFKSHTKKDVRPKHTVLSGKNKEKNKIN